MLFSPRGRSRATCCAQKMCRPRCAAAHTSGPRPRRRCSKQAIRCEQRTCIRQRTHAFPATPADGWVWLNGCSDVRSFQTVRRSGTGTILSGFMQSPLRDANCGAPTPIATLKVSIDAFEPYLERGVTATERRRRARTTETATHGSGATRAAPSFAKPGRRRRLRLRWPSMSAVSSPGPNGRDRWPRRSDARSPPAIPTPARRTIDHWLAALEQMVIAKGLTTSSMLARYHDAWDAAGKRTPHGKPIELAPHDFPSVARRLQLQIGARCPGRRSRAKAG